MNADLSNDPDSNLERSSPDLTLADLRVGECASIRELRGSEELQESLGRVGLVAGVSIDVTIQGDPAIICLGSCRIALRQEMLKAIIVDKLND